MLVINTSDRPETLSIPGRRGLKFAPGPTEVADKEYLALIKPDGKEPSIFSWFVDQGVFEVQGDIPEPPPEPESEKDKAVAKAEEKLKDAQEIAAKKKQADAKAAAKKKRIAETNAVKEEINSLLRKNQKRSMKYDDLAEDYKVERKDVKELVACKDLEASKMFRDWLKSEVA